MSGLSGVEAETPTQFCKPPATTARTRQNGAWGVQSWGGAKNKIVWQSKWSVVAKVQTANTALVRSTTMSNTALVGTAPDLRESLANENCKKQISKASKGLLTRRRKTKTNWSDMPRPL